MYLILSLLMVHVPDIVHVVVIVDNEVTILCPPVQRVEHVFTHIHTHSDVIDVTVVEPHSMENAEVRGRTRDYQ